MRCFNQIILGILLCSFLSFSSGISQNQIQATVSPDFTSVPFYKAGKVIYIEAEANGQSGFFLIDTGYRGILLLNEKYYKGIKTTKVLLGIGGKETNLRIRYVNLILGSIDLPKVYAEIIDLSSIERKKDLPILGLIGRNFFQKYECIFDYQNQKLSLFKLDRKGRKLAPEWYSDAPSDTMKFKFKGHLPVIEVQVGTTLLKLGLDSGAESNLLNEKCLEKVQSHLKCRRNGKVSGFRKETQKVPMGVLINIVIAEIPYRPMQTMLSNINHFNTELTGPTMDGIFGHEFLSQYKTAINFKKRELYIWRSKNQGIEPSVVMTN